MLKPAFAITIRDCVITKRGIKPLVLKPNKFEGGVPYLSINALETGEIKDYTFKEFGNISDENDILIVWDGSRSGLALRGKKGAIGSTIVALTPIGIMSEYLYYFVKTQFAFINGNTTGSGIPHVDSDLFFSLNIPFIEYNQQIQFVGELKKKLQQNEILLEQQEKIISEILSSTRLIYKNDKNTLTTIKNFRTTFLENGYAGILTKEWRNINELNQPALVKGEYEINETYKNLTQLPKKWKWEAMGNIAECKRGRFSARPRNDPQYYNGDYPFIQIGDIPDNGGFINRHKQTLNSEGVKVSKKFSKGTIVIAIVGSSIGNSAIIGYDMYFPDSIVGITAKQEFDNEFIAFYLQSEKNNIRSLSYSSGGQPNLKIEYINNYPVPCPPYNEQIEIVKKIKALVITTERVQSQFEMASNHYINLEKSIIAEAFKDLKVNMEINKTSVIAYLQKKKSAIENERKDYQKKHSEKKSDMKKQASAPSKLDIEEVLKQNGKQLSAKEVWDMSKYKGDIDSFYEAIKNKMNDNLSWEMTQKDEIVPLSILTLNIPEDEN